MNKNVKIAKELIKIAKSLVALDEEGDGSGFQGLIDHDNFEQDELDRAEKEGKKYILYRKEKDLWRIRACKNFRNVKKGDLGGLVESEDSLSQQGQCWIYYSEKEPFDSKVYGSAKVYGDAIIDFDSEVSGGAEVYDNAHITNGSKVYNDAKVYGKAYIENSKVHGENTEVYGNAAVSDSEVYEESKVYGSANVWDQAKIYRSKIYENGAVHGKNALVIDSEIHGNAYVDNVRVETTYQSEGKVNEYKY